jgi:hypothetical protein
MREQEARFVQDLESRRTVRSVTRAPSSSSRRWRDESSGLSDYFLTPSSLVLTVAKPGRFVYRAS